MLPIALRPMAEFIERLAENFELGLYAVYTIPSKLRPHNQWTWTQTIKNEILKKKLLRKMRKNDIQQIDTSSAALERRLVKLDHPNSNSRAPLAIIGLEDVFSQPKPDVVLIHFHAGSLLATSTDEAEITTGVKGLLEKLNVLGSTVAFLPLYDVGLGNSPLEMALDDAWLSYDIARRKFPHAKIVLSGDCFGAFLVIRLLDRLTQRANREEEQAPRQGGLRLGVRTKLPSAALLWSPVDSLSHDVDQRSLANAGCGTSDYLTGEMLSWQSKLYFRNLAEDNVVGDIHRFKFPCRVPIWITTGQAETMSPRVQLFIQSMMEIPGNDISFHSSYDAPHDVFAKGHELERENDCDNATESAVKFVERSCYPVI